MYLHGPVIPIVEYGQLEVTCNITEGNPDFTYLSWEFKPRYPGTVQRAMLENFENRVLNINRTIYSDAGFYKCIAGNSIGVHQGETEVVIHCELNFMHLIS